MKFGVFDHLDGSSAHISTLYAERLKLAEAYDRAGIYCYHLAEHHSTPLGYAPSPGIFLSAVAQRTRNLRFGPLVYLLPFYHPLRLIEEVCMLDQLSSGRFQLGVGRGISPVEAGFYGLDITELQQRFSESLQILLTGLASESLSFSGKTYTFKDVPMTMRPVQRPHPPLWYGVINSESTVWAAANNVNVVSISLAPQARVITDRYRTEWGALRKDPNAIPLMGVGRHVVVGGDDESARAAARRAYPKWRASFNYLWKKYAPDAKRSPIAALYPETFDELAAIGNGCAGSVQTVKRFIAEQAEASGINYMACWLAFGDLPLEDSLRSAALFGDEIIPYFRSRSAERILT